MPNIVQFTCIFAFSMGLLLCTFLQDPFWISCSWWCADSTGGEVKDRRALGQKGSPLAGQQLLLTLFGSKEGRWIFVGFSFIQSWFWRVLYFFSSVYIFGASWPTFGSESLVFCAASWGLPISSGAALIAGAPMTGDDGCLSFCQPWEWKVKGWNSNHSWNIHVFEVWSPLSGSLSTPLDLCKTEVDASPMVFSATHCPPAFETLWRNCLDASRALMAADDFGGSFVYLAVSQGTSWHHHEACWNRKLKYAALFSFLVNDVNHLLVGVGFVLTKRHFWVGTST